MGLSTTEPRETRRATSACPARTTPAATAIETTLYDLIAALSAAVGPDDDVLTAVVVHLLQTHRVMYMRGGVRYRLVWDGAACLTRSDPLAAARRWGSADIRMSARSMRCGEE
jgi:hypothetical protein